MSGEEARFAVYCAWCGVLITPGSDVAEERISHGICERCAPVVIAQIEERLRTSRRGGVERDAPEPQEG